MIDYINDEIAKNIKGMSETIGVDERKYWYFAGKVEALSLLKKEMESKAVLVKINKSKIDNDEWRKRDKAGIVVGDNIEYYTKEELIVDDANSMYPQIMKSIKDERTVIERAKEMFGYKVNDVWIDEKTNVNSRKNRRFLKK